MRCTTIITLALVAVAVSVLSASLVESINRIAARSPKPIKYGFGSKGRQADRRDEVMMVNKIFSLQVKRLKRQNQQTMTERLEKRRKDTKELALAVKTEMEEKINTSFSELESQMHTYINRTMYRIWGGIREDVNSNHLQLERLNYTCLQGWAELSNRCVWTEPAYYARNWTSANAFCSRWPGGSLVDIYNNLENFLVYNSVLHSISKRGCHWIGYSGTHTFHGIKFKLEYYNNWKKGQPNEGKEVLKGACIGWRDSKWEWVDMPTDLKLPFICQSDKVPRNKKHNDYFDGDK